MVVVVVEVDLVVEEVALHLEAEVDLAVVTVGDSAVTVAVEEVRYARCSCNHSSLLFVIFV